MSRFLIAASVVALCAVPALAADDGMAGYYGNTIVSTGATYEIRTHYRADHTFDMTGSMMLISHTFKGTWAINAKGELCRTWIDEAPPDTPNPLCRLLTPHKVGDTWTVGTNGDTRTVSLKAGVQ